MPELVTCPQCGLRLQVSDALLGRTVRCGGCQTPFVAALPVAARPPASPLCPRCHSSVGWDAESCCVCGQTLAPVAAEDDRGPRRDSLPHRADLIGLLGTLSLIAGSLTLCTCGLGAGLALATGIPALVMARRDLRGMAKGRIDPTGLEETEAADDRARLGVLFALLAAAFWGCVMVRY